MTALLDAPGADAHPASAAVAKRPAVIRRRCMAISYGMPGADRVAKM